MFQAVDINPGQPSEIFGDAFMRGLRKKSSNDHKIQQTVKEDSFKVLDLVFDFKLFIVDLRLS